jgi:hypothetical protein
MLLLLMMSPGWNRDAGVLLLAAGALLLAAAVLLTVLVVAAVLLPLAMSATGIIVRGCVRVPAGIIRIRHVKFVRRGGAAAGATAATTSDPQQDRQRRGWED